MSEESGIEEFTGESIVLSDLIAYQPGAVVSRTLLDKESGTVTVFAFDDGERLSEHTAPHDALLQVLDGRVSVTISGEVYELEAGETLVLPAEEPHAVDALEQFKMVLTMLN